MKLTKTQLREIVIKETLKYLEEEVAKQIASPGVTKALSNFGKMTKQELDRFLKGTGFDFKTVKGTLTGDAKDIGSAKAQEDRTYLDIVIQITSIVDKNNGRWEQVALHMASHGSALIPKKDQEIFMRLTYPEIDASERRQMFFFDLKASGGTGPGKKGPANAAARRMMGAVKRIGNEIKTGGKAYVGMDNPHWKEFLEEEISPAAPIGIEKEPEMQEKYPYWILLNDDVPVMFPRGYEKEAINTYNIMMEKEGSVKEISQELTGLVQTSGEGNE